MMQTLTLSSWMQDDPQHSVLLMDESGSVGLDLSFASHVFLMEPLENASLEEQVISRAHRMGARADVQVETLVMRVRAAELRLPTTERVCSLAVLTTVSVWTSDSAPPALTAWGFLRCAETFALSCQCAAPCYLCKHRISGLARCTGDTQ